MEARAITANDGLGEEGVTGERLAGLPAAQLVRERWQSLNGLWDYAVTATNAARPETFAGQILVPFCIESALSGVGRRVTPHEALWYHRSFKIPAEWSRQRVLLHFDAVDWQTEIWLNGKQMPTHRGGYDRFSFDITDAMKPVGPQELVLRVWDPGAACSTDPAGKWPHQPFGKQAPGLDCTHYASVTGIWQSVWLEPVPAVSVESLTLKPDVDAACLRMTVAARGGTGACAVVAEVLDGTQVVAKVAGNTGAEFAVPVPRAKLWSPERPFLYGLRVTLTGGGGTADTVQSYFGMRKYSVGPDEKGIPRIQLNGKPVFLMGTADQGYWPDGIYTAPSPEALRSDVELLKRLGFNSVRKHVKVEPDQWYACCDRLGIIVWQDMPSTLPPSFAGKPELKLSATDQSQFESELHQMVVQHINHPSIGIWVIFNETWGQHRSADLVRAVKSWDPTRLVNEASGAQDFGHGDMTDGHQYSGPLPGPTRASPHATPTQWQWGVEARPVAPRASVLGEFGGLMLVVEGHTWNAVPNISGFIGAGYPFMKNAGELMSRYEQMLGDVVKLKRDWGVSGAIFTSLTDIEDELNGFVTYDRKVAKMDFDRAAAANRHAVEDVTSTVAVPAVPVPAAVKTAKPPRLSPP